jgi:hypothetical protein
LVSAEGHGFSRAAQDGNEAFQDLQALGFTASAAEAVVSLGAVVGTAKAVP